MLAEFNLEGRRILCIGAGRGIGREVSLVLAEAGASVAVASQNPANAEAVASRIRSLGRGSASYGVDATNEESMLRLATDVRSQFGEIDALINCVGSSFRRPIIPLPNGPTGEMPFSEWRSIVDLNLLNAYLGARAFGPAMLSRGSGSMINISSWVQARGRPTSAAYDSAKAALNQLTRTLAVEWAPYGVRVNAIGPGIFPDPEQESPEEYEAHCQQIAKRVPLGRAGRLRDIGLMALYLVSDAASYVTGQVYVVDGGLSLA